MDAAAGNDLETPKRHFNHPGQVPDNGLYYGVNLINGNSVETADSLVFTEKKDALSTARKHKGARFKAFSSRIEALSFASQQTDNMTPTFSSTNSQSSLSNSPDISPIVGEKSSLFKAPRSQDLVKLRKAIESGDAEFFSLTVWSNPRYLISCGDTPTILQEGSRYNGLHVAAKGNQATICRLLLNILEDERFITLLFNDVSEAIRNQRRDFIVDLYLNMPDKGMCETPLHLASKFGCSLVVDVLLSSPFCDRERANKYGKIAQEIICERFGNAELTKEIQALFDARYFIPVLRTEDNSIQPIVGRPFLMEHSKATGQKQMESPKFSLLLVRAKAGPMTSNQADLFYKTWKFPSSPFSDPHLMEARLSDPEKGLERVGRELAKKFNVPWTEYWPFLGCWCDLTTKEGMTLLENHLKQLYINAVNEKRVFSFDSVINETLSPISKLCNQLDGFHLNSYSSKPISPDTPSIFGWKNPVHEASTPNQSKDSISKVLLFDSPTQDQSNLSDKPRGINVYTDKVSEMLSSCLSELVKDQYDVQSNTRTSYLDNVLPHIEKLLSVIDQNQKPSNSTLHRVVAESTAQKLADEFTRQDIQRVSFTIYKMKSEEKCSKLDGSSSTDEDSFEKKLSKSPLKSRSRESLNREYKRHSCASIPNPRKKLAREHLKCILHQLGQCLGNVNEASHDCSCLWTLPIHYPSWASSSLKTSSPKVKGHESLQNSSSSCSDESTSGIQRIFIEDEDEECFHTPPDSSSSGKSSPMELYTPEEGMRIYMQGMKPSKPDLDVLNALGSFPIDPLFYPHLTLWRHLIDSHPKEDLRRFSSPMHNSSSRNPTPKSAPSRLANSILETPLFSSKTTVDWKGLHKTAPIRWNKNDKGPRNLYNRFMNFND